LGQIGALEREITNGFVAISGKTAAGPAALGRALRVMKPGQRKRAAVQAIAYESGWNLVRANSGARLWGAEFDRPDTDLLEVEANVASAVASAVARPVGPGGAACSRFGSDS